MSATMAYGIDSWYPVLRGGLAPSAFVDAGEANAVRHVKEAWEALPEGGRLILQAAAPVGSRPSFGPLEAGLKDRGFAERFVVYPGTGGAFTLLPCAHGSAFRGGMALLPRGRARGRALWALIRAASLFRLPLRLGRPEIAIWTKGKPSDESEDLPVLPIAGSIAVAAGVPDRNQKVIVRALDRRGTARAILKLGFSERSDDAIEREGRALIRMAELLPDRAPKFIAQGTRAGRRWLAQEVLEGHRAGDGISPSHSEFLVELSRLERGSCTLERLQAFGDASRHLETLDPSFDPDWHRDYSELSAALVSSLDGAEIPTTLAHGDFTPWNTVQRGGVLRAFDWEYFSEQSPALNDLLHFHLQTGVLVKHHPGERIFDELAALFAGPGAEVVRDLGLGREDVLRMVAIYVLHEGTSSEVLERLRPAPFAQAAWLRRAHLVLCRRLTGLLRDRQLPLWTKIEGSAANAPAPPTSKGARSAA